MEITAWEAGSGPFPARRPFALVPVAVVTVVAVAVMFAFAGRYGYFGDELYFVIAGANPAWGYADQQPLVPFLAVTMEWLFPGSLVALRAPSILAFGLGAVVAALVARELGGDRRAQAFTTTAFVLSLASMYRNLNTIGLDILGWSLLTLLLLRWLRTHRAGEHDDRLLLLSGVVVALSVQVKIHVAVFVVVILLTLTVLGPRAIFRRPLLWVGALIVAVVTVPTVVWQFTHGWPQLAVARSSSAEMTSVGGRLFSFVGMLALLGLVFGVVLGGYGLWRLLRAEETRPYRFLGWSAVGVIAVFLAVGGKPYYVAGVFPVLWAAGALGFQRRREAGAAENRRRWGWLAWPALAVSVVVTVQSLPLASVESFAERDTAPVDFRGSEIGWPKLAADVEEIYHELPRRQREHTVVLGSHYWTASAVEFHGRRADLPEAYSGSRGFWFFGHPPAETTTVIHIGEIAPGAREHFDRIRRVGTVDNGLGVDNVVQGQPIQLADVTGVDWERAWPEFRDMTLSL
ncbi:Dolichyl-phosphate-mannose-protein mannosyltransferase [Actinopolyspora mzabensis]|uniref:Dolichyl-phosphate-mannose-protein mannosyltransferase n=1 Tax=Actinopolyspora mzabensis TaxID=995066 RepID=A0A1G8Z3K9_ACTMZ|nr:glycosyltransferase family 39 protein [Actinopolyspora mzabensis]SDK09557.1 Dolichyl-phosphate-mannose-protein mannosyltransferase [Actinopolyspora mzabensis]